MIMLFDKIDRKRRDLVALNERQVSWYLGYLELSQFPSMEEALKRVNFFKRNHNNSVLLVDN